LILSLQKPYDLWVYKDNGTIVSMLHISMSHVVMFFFTGFNKQDKQTNDYKKGESVHIIQIFIKTI